jgi:hypothetical protein
VIDYKKKSKLSEEFFKWMEKYHNLKSKFVSDTEYEAFRNMSRDRLMIMIDDL